MLLISLSVKVLILLSTELWVFWLPAITDTCKNFNCGRKDPNDDENLWNTPAQKKKILPLLFFFLFLIEIESIYKAVLVSGIQFATATPGTWVQACII